MESAPGTLIFINEYMHMLDSSVWANERDTIHLTLREREIKCKGWRDRSSTEKTDCPVTHLLPEILWATVQPKSHKNQLSAAGFDTKTTRFIF